MHRTKHFLKHATGLSLLGLAVIVSGCGGAVSGADDPAAPQADASAYRDVLSYCRESEPAGIDATRDGWMTSLLSSDQYGTVTTGMVSVGGSTSKWETPVDLYVPLNFGMSAYGRPEWNMGVRFPTVLAKQSVACVRQASHTYVPRALDFPGAPVVPALPQNIWDSYWDRALPVSRLAGKALTGFEFVSNFTPDSGDAFFNLDKSRTTAPSTWSVCYLAPKSVQWDCARPGVADAGTYWQISVQRPRPGVYVLVSPPVTP
ncbi:MAG: hypothetical protein JWQ01_2618 [Massilia sp.]|nr:hypothetical protein [Massilia sp.]